MKRLMLLSLLVIGSIASAIAQTTAIGHIENPPPPITVTVVRSQKGLEVATALFKRQGVSLLASFSSDYGRHWLFSSNQMLIWPTEAGDKDLGTAAQSGILFQVEDPLTTARVEASILQGLKLPYTFTSHKDSKVKALTAWISTQAIGGGKVFMIYTTPFPGK